MMVRRDTRGSWSLIGMLVVVVLIGIVLYITLGGYLKTMQRTTGPATGAAGGLAPVDGIENAGEGQTPMDVAHDVECRNALDQMRKAIEMYKAQSEDGVPSNLEALTTQGVPKDWLSCPIGKEPYKYDPQTGRVWCVHPGHEKY